jgi:simple sugar transport system ATP-binding protein
MAGVTSGHLNARAKTGLNTMPDDPHQNRSEYLLQLERVSKSYGGLRALNEVSVGIRYAEIHCLVGQNGSGKSTLIKIVSGVEQADSGQILFDNQPLLTSNAADSIHRGIQVIYQDPSLFPNLSVAENVVISEILAKRARHINWRKLRQRAKEVVGKIQLKIDLDAPVQILSFAQQQLVAICRALSNDVRLLIMDEPTTALTRREVEILLDVVRGLQSKGISILFVSHKLNEVFEIAQRFTVLRDSRWIGTYERGELTLPKLVTLMTGQDVATEPFRAPAEGKRPLLEVSNLSRTNEFEDVSFVLREGEVLGLTGLLGSGRTELAVALFGLTKPDRGEIRISGRQARIGSAQAAIRLGLGYVPEDRLRQGLVIGQSIGANIILSTCTHVLNRLGLIDAIKRTREIQHWIKALGIKVSDPELPIETLSGGNQQKAVIARWLATKPKVLILDSPTVGIDVGAKRSVHQLIHELAMAGVGIILITDEIDEALNNCTRVLLMRNGRIIANLNSSQEDETSVQARLEAA